MDVIWESRLRRSLTLPRISHIGHAWILALTIAVGGCAWQPVEPPDARTAGAAEPVPVSSTIGERVASIALEQIGTPYRYGGQTPAGFDCSGLVHYAYGQAGKSVPRTTGGLWSRAQPVARNELRAGDLLFFSIDGKMQHVGLYVGNGRFAHAPSSGRTVTVESLTTEFYRQAFLRGGRLQ